MNSIAVSISHDTLGPLKFVVLCQIGDNSRISTFNVVENQRQELYTFLHNHLRAYAGQEEKCWRFVEAVYWILSTGTQWRDLPYDFGKLNSVFKHYARWYENGVWADMFKQFAQDLDMVAVMPGSTAVRVHMCAVGRSQNGDANKNSA